MEKLPGKGKEEASVPCLSEDHFYENSVGVGVEQARGQEAEETETERREEQERIEFAGPANNIRNNSNNGHLQQNAPDVPCSSTEFQSLKDWKTKLRKRLGEKVWKMLSNQIAVQIDVPPRVGTRYLDSHGAIALNKATEPFFRALHGIWLCFRKKTFNLSNCSGLEYLQQCVDNLPPGEREKFPPSLKDIGTFNPGTVEEQQRYKLCGDPRGDRTPVTKLYKVTGLPEPARAQLRLYSTCRNWRNNMDDGHIEAIVTALIHVAEASTPFRRTESPKQEKMKVMRSKKSAKKRLEMDSIEERKLEARKKKDEVEDEEDFDLDF